MALLALEVRCVALSEQQNPHHAKALLQCFLNFVIVQDTESIGDSVFQQILASRTFSAILVGGTASNQEKCSTPVAQERIFNLFVR